MKTTLTTKGKIYISLSLLICGLMFPMLAARMALLATEFLLDFLAFLVDLLPKI